MRARRSHARIALRRGRESQARRKRPARARLEQRQPHGARRSTADRPARGPETVNYHLNELYGFPAIVQKIKFQVTDSEKHPEDKNYKQALEAIKVILSKLKYNSNTETAKVELQPVIDYFTSLKKKYKSDEKGDMKIKHWTGWNLAQLYLCLDDIESASVEAKYLIALDYEKSDGEKLLEEINDIKEDFKRIQVNTRRLKEVE